MNEDAILLSLLENHSTYYSNNINSANIRDRIEADNIEQLTRWKDLIQQVIKKIPLYADDKSYVELLIETCTSNYISGTSITPANSGLEVKRLLPTLTTTNFDILVNVNPTILLGAFVSTATLSLSERNLPYNTKHQLSPLLIVSVAKFEALKNLFPVKTANDESTRQTNEKIDELKSRQNALEEAKTLKGVSNVWSFRSRWLNFQFWIGLITIAAAVGFGAYYFLENAKDLLLQIPKKGDGDIAYGTLALTFVPIIAVGWVLRLIGRLVTSSLTLKEDADHRRSMLETYFNLISDPNAKFEDKERSLILKAIFRPLPGQKCDEVDPPTLPDFVKDHFGGKDSK